MRAEGSTSVDDERENHIAMDLGAVVRSTGITWLDHWNYKASHCPTIRLVSMVAGGCSTGEGICQRQAQGEEVHGTSQSTEAISV